MRRRGRQPRAAARSRAGAEAAAALLRRGPHRRRHHRHAGRGVRRRALAADLHAVPPGAPGDPGALHRERHDARHEPAGGAEVLPLPLSAGPHRRRVADRHRRPSRGERVRRAVPAPARGPRGVPPSGRAVRVRPGRVPEVPRRRSDRGRGSPARHPRVPDRLRRARRNGRQRARTRGDRAIGPDPGVHLRGHLRCRHRGADRVREPGGLRDAGVRLRGAARPALPPADPPPPARRQRVPDEPVSDVRRLPPRQGEPRRRRAPVAQGRLRPAGRVRRHAHAHGRGRRRRRDQLHGHHGAQGRRGAAESRQLPLRHGPGADELRLLARGLQRSGPLLPVRARGPDRRGGDQARRPLPPAGRVVLAPDRGQPRDRAARRGTVPGRHRRDVPELRRDLRLQAPVRRAHRLAPCIRLAGARRGRQGAVHVRRLSGHHGSQADGDRAAPGEGGRRGGDTGQVQLPREHEPRDPHPDERHHRPVAPRPEDAAQRQAAGLRRQDPQRRDVAPGHHQRHPRLLEDRGREAQTSRRSPSGSTRSSRASPR